MGGKKKVTIGYWYKLAAHFGVGIGPVDEVQEIRGGSKSAWRGSVTESGTITIDAPNLWGGEKDQGGIQTDVDLLLGEESQVPNAYLTSTFGDQQPAWRGHFTFVLKGGKYGAMNPYPQRLSVKFKRILQGWDGDAWNPEQAAIVVNAGQVFTSDLAFAATSASVDGSTAAIELSGGFDATSVIVIEKPAGLTYKAWSAWDEDTEAPSFKAWTNKFYVTNGEGISTSYWPEFYFTQEQAEFEVSDRRVTLTGSDYYKIWLYDTPVLDNRGGLSLRIYRDAIVGMNPAHVMYYAHTHGDMGREPAEKINEASFLAASDWFYNEGFGICTSYDPGQESVDEFNNRIGRVAGCSVNRSRVNGQLYLDIANGVYELEELPILTDDDILEFREVPSSLENAVNSVSVRYFHTERKEKIITPPVRALGLAREYGTVHQTLDFPEIPTGDLALRVATRELRARCTPSRTFELKTTRVPYAWRPNTYFRLQVPKRGIADMVCLLAEKDSGTLRSGAMSIIAVQDIYSLPLTTFVEIEEGVDTRPNPVPQPVTLQRAFEAPYGMLVTRMSPGDLAVLDPSAGFLVAAAADPATSRDFTMMVSPHGIDEYTEAGDSEFCPTALVVDAGGYDDTVFTLASGKLLDQVEVGMAALWGNEFVRIDAINLAVDPPELELGRGCFDTPPLKHSAGERIYFIDAAAASDPTEYADGEVVDVKLLTNTGSARLALASATAVEVTLDQRAYRPFPPGNLRINGIAYPAEVQSVFGVSWAHRDRVLQQDQLIDATQGDVGPEDGTTYRVDVYLDDVLKSSTSGISGTSLADNFMNGIGTGRVEVWAERDSLASLVAATAEFDYLGFWIRQPGGGALNEAYNETLVVENMSGVITWELAAGTLPPGLILNSELGTISGVPSTAGYYTFTLQASNLDGDSVQREVTTGIGTLVSLLHMDGANAGTTFTDSVDAGAWTAVGNAQTQTAAPKFGATSARFDGSGDRVHRTKAGHALGTGDLTIDFWLRPASSTNIHARAIQFGANTTAGGLWLIRHESTNPLQMRVDTYASAYAHMFNNISGFSIDAYSHVALMRKSGTWYIAVGGEIKDTNIALGSYNVTQQQVNIGSNSADGESYHGNIDEVRIMSGAARWTEKFTPPTAASNYGTADPGDFMVTEDGANNVSESRDNHSRED